MSDEHKSPIHGSRTGEIPAVSEPGQLHEPPQPDSIPEMPDANSTTGKFYFKRPPEGVDTARLRDDSATASEYMGAGKRRG